VWDSEVPRATDFDRILKVDRNELSRINIKAIMENLKPICRLDPQHPEKYRDSDLLKSLLRGHIQSYAAAAPSQIVAPDRIGG